MSRNGSGPDAEAGADAEGACGEYGCIVPTPIDRWIADNGQRWSIHGPEISAGVHVLSVRVWVNYAKPGIRTPAQAHSELIPVHQWQADIKRNGMSIADWARSAAVRARWMVGQAVEYLDKRRELPVGHKLALIAGETARTEAKALLGWTEGTAKLSRLGEVVRLEAQSGVKALAGGADG